MKIAKIRKPNRSDRGAIEVEYLAPLEFRLEGMYLDPIVAKKLQVALESGLNILLDGPQGCGKTTLASTVAETLGMEFVFFNCGAVIDASDFFAAIQVRASETGQPVTDFIKTDVLRALESAVDHSDKRYLVFLDELNRCQESARNVLMPMLDGNRRLFHPIENTFFPISDNVQFIAAVNRGSGFSGTFAIDASQLDRFAPLQLDYPPPEAEEKLLQARHPELPQERIRDIVRIANRIRASDQMETGLSMRATDEACIYLKHPLFDGGSRETLEQILQSSFCGRFAGRWNDKNSDSGIAWEIIKATLASR